MERSIVRQQLIVGLAGSAVLSAVLAAAAVASKGHDETEIGPMTKVVCTLSPKAVIENGDEEIEINPPDIVIPC